MEDCETVKMGCLENQQISYYEKHPRRFSRNLFCNFFFPLEGKKTLSN